MSKPQKALVLGGTSGLVGQALVEALHESRWDVTAASRADIRFDAPDTADRLARIVQDAEPDCVFNAIGYTQVDRAEDEPEEAALINRTFPVMLGRIIKNTPATLVHFSTDFVFDGKKDAPYTTDDPARPLSVYGKTKRSGEEALLSLDLPRCVIVRTAWLFGSGRKNFVSTILNACRENHTLNVVYDQVGSPTYTSDLAQYTLKLVDSGASGIFHIVNSGKASWCELAGEAIRLAQMECMVNPVPSSEYPQKAPRPAYSVLDCKELGRIAGISPRPWPQALREYIFKDFPPE